MANQKVDVILPVYNSINWVEKALSSLFLTGNFEYINQIFVLDDGSADSNKLWLNEICQGRTKVTLIHNDQNMGYTKTVNKAMKLCPADFLLVLNSDCVLTPHTLEKLLYHATKNPNIGLVSPISNNSPNVSLPMQDGENALILNSKLGSIFSRQSVKACSIVGNCLLISRECYKALGDFSLDYGSGYGEETDYQFRAHEAGFEALIALDSYVYHRGAASFGSSPKIESQRIFNHGLFMNKWGDQYKVRWANYVINEPIAKIQREISQQNSFEYDVLFILPGFSPTAGGIRVVAKIINELIANGINANVNCIQKIKFDWSKELLLFNPLFYSFDELTYEVKVKARHIIATSWDTYAFAKVLAHRKNAVLHYFVQGWEPYFDNGNQYNIVIDGYRSVENIVTISSWLKEKLLKVGAPKVNLCRMGIDHKLLNQKHKTFEERSIDVLFVLRGQYIKGDWIQRDLISRLLAEGTYKIQVVIPDKNFHADLLPTEKMLVHIGSYSVQDLQNWLMDTKVYIDTSKHEGFGLLPIEAMAFGCLVIASNSKGCLEYLSNHENGFLINEANNPDRYFQKIQEIMGESSESNNKIVHSAIQRAATFSEKHFLKDFLEYCKSSLANTHLKPCQISPDEEMRLLKYIPFRGVLMKLYLNYGRGFSEISAITTSFEFGFQFTKTIELYAEEILQEIRLDPYEHGDIFLKEDASITFYAADGEHYQVNLVDIPGPFFRLDGKLIYLMDDPSVQIPVGRHIKRISISFFCDRLPIAKKDELINHLISVAKAPPSPPTKIYIDRPMTLRESVRKVGRKIVNKVKMPLLS